MLSQMPQRRTPYAIRARNLDGLMKYTLPALWGSKSGLVLVRAELGRRGVVGGQEDTIAGGELEMLVAVRVSSKQGSQHLLRCPRIYGRLPLFGIARARPRGISVAPADEPVSRRRTVMRLRRELSGPMPY